MSLERFVNVELDLTACSLPKVCDLSGRSFYLDKEMTQPVNVHAFAGTGVAIRIFA